MVAGPLRVSCASDSCTALAEAKNDRQFTCVLHLLHAGAALEWLREWRLSITKHGVVVWGPARQRSPNLATTRTRSVAPAQLLVPVVTKQQHHRALHGSHGSLQGTKQCSPYLPLKSSSTFYQQAAKCRLCCATRQQAAWSANLVEA